MQILAIERRVDEAPLQLKNGGYAFDGSSGAECMAEQ
jgi:hypothetical protein